MLSYGKEIREYNQAKTDARFKSKPSDLQYLAESYLDYIDELNIS
jgi:hypothetical protein